MPYRLLTLESLLIRLGQMRCKSFHLVNLSKSRPIGNIRTHRVRVETIFGGLPCRRSLSPRVSPSRAPVLSCAHLLPCSCYAYKLHIPTLQDSAHTQYPICPPQRGTLKWHIRIQNQSNEMISFTDHGSLSQVNVNI